jgi:hypothetical protein
MNYLLNQIFSLSYYQFNSITMYKQIKQWCLYKVNSSIEKIYYNHVNIFKGFNSFKYLMHKLLIRQHNEFSKQRASKSPYRKNAARIVFLSMQDCIQRTFRRLSFNSSIIISWLSQFPLSFQVNLITKLPHFD